MTTTWLVDGWQQRTQQKLAIAGCMAALLSLRKDPLRTTSRLRDFSQKLVGYGAAAIIFSGVQETGRAVRGRHDFLNSAVSGAVTGALVVGHYQGPQYRLLGIVTWGSIAAVLHIANSVLQPRYYIEDYLVSEGLLSPQALRHRQTPSLDPKKPIESGIFFPEYEHRDILLEAKAIRERELRDLSEKAATAANTASVAVAAAAAGDAPGRHDAAELEDIADDDPGYQAWLQNSGFQADALLLKPQEQQEQQQQVSELVLPLQQSSSGNNSSSSSSSGPSSAGAVRNNTLGWQDENGAVGGKGPRVVPPGEKGNWSIWLKPWQWRLSKSPDRARNGDESVRDT